MDLPWIPIEKYDFDNQPTVMFAASYILRQAATNETNIQWRYDIGIGRKNSAFSATTPSYTARLGDSKPSYFMFITPPKNGS